MGRHAEASEIEAHDKFRITHPLNRFGFQFRAAFPTGSYPLGAGGRRIMAGGLRATAFSEEILNRPYTVAEFHRSSYPPGTGGGQIISGGLRGTVFSKEILNHPYMV
ncbi:hypothetical protein CEXT_10341 [Caerostris extrusa]|uniref:Uncharacterized protein n=1 Tax=Caerostris extrusa TaxID=172846 RepID=A0AAV4RJV6_CAEEX|nr:hypothetical protein CEXT_10341 [Caerostris extrusa]